MLSGELIAGLFGIHTGLLTKMCNSKASKGIIKLADMIFHVTQKYAQIRLFFGPLIYFYFVVFLLRPMD